jgi:uncharacterized membrane protein
MQAGTIPQEETLTQTGASRFTGLQSFSFLLAGLCVLVGIFLRFYNLDQRELWYDEAIHLSVAQGHSDYLVTDKLYTNSEIASRLKPAPGASVQQVLDASVTHCHWHPPTFDLLEHFWLKLFGTTLFIARALPVVLGLLIIPAAYLLGFECSRNRQAAAWSAALVAMSPFAVTYGQEINGYSLAIALIVLSHALFLRAFRKNNVASWSLYVLATAAAYYISYQTTWAVVCQGAFALLVCRKNLKALAAPLMAFAAVAVSAAPVLLYMFNHRKAWLSALDWLSQATAPLNYKLMSILGYTTAGLIQFKTPFFDPTGLTNFRDVSNSVYLVVFLAFVFCWRSFARTRYLLICMLINVVPLFLSDLIGGGIRSTIPRYHFMVIMSSVIAVGCFIGYLAQRTKTFKFSLAFLVAAGFVIAGECMSCWVLANSPVSENRALRKVYLTEVANYLNRQQGRTVLIVDASKPTGPFQSIALSDRAKSADFYYFRTKLDKAGLQGYNNVVLLDPSETLTKAATADGFTIRQANRSKKLFVIE